MGTGGSSRYWPREPEFLQIFENALNTPEGIILVTGPTGSGKTTTLFGCLNYLRDKFGSEYNITTVEDPVEYRIEGVNHVEVKPEIGFTFASSLRSIVRQDPDFLMIGEIRDKDTAEIAMQSALTGHLVLSTLHTNNALGAVPRLLDLGAQPFMLASTVILLQAQRLIRKLCPKCGHNQTLTEKEIAEKLRHNGMMHRRDELMATPVYKPYHEGKRRGCDACENSGYKGRLAVMELLPIMPKMKELIERQASLLEMTQYAVSQGFRLLVEHGLDHVKEGTCSLDEALELTPSNYEHVAPASPVTVSMSTPEVTGSPRAKQTHYATSPPPAMRPPVRTAGRAGKSRVIVID